jgi:hypothetical protein
MVKAHRLKQHGPLQMPRRVKREPTPPPPPESPPAQPPVSETSPSKKKKKKKRAKAVNGSPYHAEEEEEEEEEDDVDMPPLEPLVSPPLRTGLSPELESVHLSTTASLNASAAATAKLSATAAAAQAELLATADDLYRRMDADPEGGMGLADDDEYWAALPAHIRNFVRTTRSQSAMTAGDESAIKAQAMYAIAQQMVQSGLKAAHGAPGANGTGPTKGAPGYPPGAYPSSLPFDPAIFSNRAFTEAVEQAAAAHGRLPPHGVSGYLDIMLSNTFEMGDYAADYADDDYYTEDEELEEDMFEHDVEYGHPPARLPSLPAAHDVGGEHAPLSAGAPPTATRANKKKKKRKGKGAVGVAAPAVPHGAPNESPPRVPTVPPPVTQEFVTRDTHPQTMPAPARPPATTANPPPSSRAAGKQPMNYPPPTAPAANPPTPAQTARAASKAPAHPAAYHNHPHHHPSPPSSNASAQTKARPAAGNPPASKANNSKIWNTNSAQERERIKEFWLGLREEERRDLVKVEKEAVLKKMKEQQKHSCSCAVCGRKRFVIVVWSRARACG